MKCVNKAGHRKSVWLVFHYKTIPVDFVVFQILICAAQTINPAGIYLLKI